MKRYFYVALAWLCLPVAILLYLVTILAILFSSGDATNNLADRCEDALDWLGRNVIANAFPNPEE